MADTSAETDSSSNLPPLVRAMIWLAVLVVVLVFTVDVIEFAMQF